jgi:para-nitrobenzyl esterase
MAIVRTQSGLIAGEAGADGVISFKGVPYAQPPLAALRWRAPQPVTPWNGVRSATSFGPACIQPLMPENSLLYGGEREMSEDCLYLNIYTANVDVAEHRPVILWLHHGGFMMGWSGAPIYDGSALARAGAVVVTVNYRLGRLGFLAHPALTAESPEHSSGNYGLMDQIAALTWVRDNIAAFGGDPDCVTIYGVSAGSFSVSALMASPLAQGLFHRAIGGSGGAFGPQANSSEIGDCLQPLAAAERTCAELMSSIGATTAAELRALSAEQILAAKIPEFWLARRGLLDTTYPIVDGYVLPDEPRRIFAARRHNDVPLITGSNADEASITPFNGDTDTYLADNRALLGPLFERFIKLFPAGPDGQTALSSAAANSDRLFSWQNWAWARLQAQYGRNPVYYYHFAHEPPVPANRVAEQGMTARVGAFHSAEIPYVFRNLAARDWPWSETDRELSETLSGYWLDFARSGDPNGGGRSRWLAFSMKDQHLMRFAAGAIPSLARASERFMFWDEFYGWSNAARGNVSAA